MFAFTVQPDKENEVNVAANVKDVNAPVAKPLCFDNPAPVATKSSKSKEMSWVDIQSKNFTEWINFAFTQADSEGNALEQAEEIKEKMFNSFRKVSQEIDNGQLTVRGERDIHVDVGLQDVLLELFQSYNMAWLRIGCKVILEFQPVASPKQFQKQILQSMLWTDQKKVDGPELEKHFLKKFFEFVLFLDFAKKSNLVNAALFEKKSKIKSSKDILAVICKEFLKGEGDIFKHLALLDYKPSYQQTDLDEFNFSVNNIAVDLRDGVRLARLVDMLGSVDSEEGEQTPSLCSRLWVPAPNISRKEHNVKILLNALFSNLSDKERCVKPTDIVSGNRDKTFLLLWEIFFQVKLKDLIDCGTIECEIAAIESGESLLEEELDALNTSSAAVRVPELESCEEDELTSGHIADKLAASLKQWFKAMLASSLGDEHPTVKAFNNAATYSTTPSTTMFGDGSALCYMVNYYHSNLLKLDDILTAEKPTLGSTSAASAPKDVNSKASINRRREHNWLMFSQATSLITGIPTITPDCLSSKPLCENQPFLIFLAYLFSRLQMSKKEVGLTAMQSSAMEMAWDALTADASNYSDMSVGMSDDAPASKKRKSAPLAARATASSIAAAEAARTRKSMNDSKMKPLAKKGKVVTASVYLKEERGKKRHSGGSTGLSAAKRAMTRTRNSFTVMPDFDDDDLCMDLEPLDEGDEEMECSSKRARTAKSTGCIARNRRSSTGGNAFEPVVILSKKQQEEEAAKAQKALDDIAEAERLAVEAEERVKTEQWLDAQRVEEEAALVDAQQKATEDAVAAQKLADEEATEAERLAAIATAEADRLVQLAEQEAREEEAREALEMSIMEEELSVEEEAARRAVEEAEEAERVQEELMRQREIAHQQQLAKEQTEKAKRALAAAAAMDKAKRAADGIQAMRDKAAKIAKHQEEMLKAQRERDAEEAIAREEEDRLLAEQEATAAAQLLLAKEQELEVAQFRAVTTIQAFRRGYLTRMQRKRKLSVIHSKLSKATKDAHSNPSQSIGARTADAIAALRTYANETDPNKAKQLQSGTKSPTKSVSKSPRKARKITVVELLDACKALEFSTEVSKTCCNNLIRGETSSLLLHLIRTCDRSRDSQELLHHALITLLNVARYDELAYFVSQGDNSSIATIVDLLQMFRDKKAVFSVACELMCRIITADVSAKTMCAAPSETYKRIAAISQIIESKFKIESRLKAIADKKAAASGLPRPDNQLSPCKGKYLASKEPIDCIRLLMKLIV